MNEAKLTTKFGKWAKARMNKTFAFEAKIAKTSSLPFDSVLDHQVTGLYYVKHGLLFHKIADGSGRQTPFDGFMLSQEPAYVVIFWYEPRKPVTVSMIDIDMWLAEKDKSARKSITLKRSCEIGRCHEM